MRTCSSSTKAVGRSGRSTPRISQRVKRDADREALHAMYRRRVGERRALARALQESDRKRYAGRARYWPSRVKDPAQMSIDLGYGKRLGRHSRS
jgi:hypothetical protein